MIKGLRKFHGVPIPARKERDEDLLLFRELHKKERDRLVSLLQPVSEEFEASGNYPLYRMTSAKKGSGDEFLGDSEKSDYNWLKTPPATPLFQSLEMDATASQLAVQRELPIVLPLSRFAGNSVTTNESSDRIKSPNPKQKAPPRSVTPSQRPSVSAAPETKAPTKNKPIMSSNQKMNQSMISIDTPISRTANAVRTVAKPILNTQRKEGPLSFLASNLSKSMGTSDTKLNTISRGLSPMVRSTIPVQAPGYTDEKTRNQRTNRSSSVARTDRSSSVTRTDRSSSVTRTNRSSSALRGRNQNQSLLPAANVNAVQKPESSPKTITRQSCSPSVMRGRKVETEKESIMSNKVETCSHEITNKARTQLAGGNGTQFQGSRMVDKFMNARKSSTEEKETRSNLRGSINESYGYGRNMMSKSLLDMTLKHTDVKREPAWARNFHRASTTSGRNANARIKSPPSSSSTSGAA
ncbi:uncharacterized protein LOC131326838 isoform X2 [Rhododendron vialii]|uniref:uncharacterized protein LOC131326838 isoform X2 n=1 Tax=Rhododendron vialii TaxID=182163 RepID=UPI00265FFE30|nr:uncharacterized protein LOC131326838 isoform X2 [Rhododendron vialii]